MVKPAIQILLIEDNQTDVLLLEEALNRDAFNSYELKVAECLSTGLETLYARKFDLILLDLGLPDSQGLDTFLKIHAKYPQIPVVVLSGLMDEQLSLEALQSGAQDYLVKGPTGWEIASRAIRHAIERQQLQANLRESEENYRRLFTEMLDGFALHEVICDESGQPYDYRFLEVNPAFERITGLRAAELIGRTAREVLPNLETVWIERYGRVALTGEPAHFEEFSGDLGGYYEITAFRPRPNQFAVILMDITQRKRAEESLRSSETKYRKLFDEMSNGCALHQVICDAASTPVDYVTLDVNGAFETLLGVKREQVIGRKASEILPPEELKGWMAIFGTTALTGASTKYEMYSPVNERYFEGVAFSPEPGKFAVTFNDVTERKLAQEKLNQSENRYRLATKATNDVFWEWNAKNHQLLWTENAQTVFGYSPEQDSFNEKWWDEHIHPDDRERVLSKLNDLIAGNESIWSEEYRFQRNDGSYLHISNQAYVERDENGAPLRMIGAMSNITERKRAEQALRESEEHYRALFEHLPIPAFTKNREGVYISSNAENQKYWASSPIGRSDAELLPPSEAAALREFDLRVMETGDSLNSEEYFKNTPLGNRRFLARKVPLRDGSGNIVGILGASIDITEREQAEETMRLNEKKFKTLFEIAPVGISVLDQNQNIVDANYALQVITGLKRKKLLNGGYRSRTYLKPDGSTMTPDEFASTRALKENMPVFDIETGIVTEDRGVVWTQVSAAPLDMPDASLVVVTQDITERKQVEKALRQRLAELETLYESGLSLSQLLEPQQIGQKIIDILAEKLDWYHTTIRLYHPESDSLELLAYNIAGKITDEERRTIGKRFRALIAHSGDGLSGWALQHAQTVRCGDILRDSRYIETVPGLRSGLYVPIKTGERAIGVISVESEKPDYFTAEDEHLVVTLAAQAAVALENIRLFLDLQKSNDGLFRAYDETIEGWSRALDLRDKETEGHTQRVTSLAEELARAMGIPEVDLKHIRWGALLHDIGKMGVPDRILLKPDKLNDDEWVIMREHSTHAYNLLTRIEYLRAALNIPRYHHERWDGSGYPDGLRGEQIPLEARIFAVIDVFDALTSDRPYRPAWPKAKAINYIREQSGSHFDPHVVEAFMKLIDKT